MPNLSKRLALLELEVTSGRSEHTDFSRGEYADALLQKINQEQICIVLVNWQNWLT